MSNSSGTSVPFVSSITFSHRGFTLIEFLTVIGLIAVLSGAGFAAFSSYGNTQTVKTATADVATLLQSARSQALSQVKPVQCANRPLEKYQVSFTVPGSTYTLDAVCGGTVYTLERKTLPSRVSFVVGSVSRVSFIVITGAAAPSGLITISGYGKNDTISVNTAGNISLQ